MRVVLLILVVVLVAGCTQGTLQTTGSSVVVAKIGDGEAKEIQEPNAQNVTIMILGGSG